MKNSNELNFINRLFDIPEDEAIDQSTEDDYSDFVFNGDNSTSANENTEHEMKDSSENKNDE